MRSFLLKNKFPIVKWGSIPEGIMFKGKVPEGYNLAISPTPGYVVIDVDVDIEKGKNGFNNIPKVVLKELESTLNYSTKRGGKHYWIKYSGIRPLGNKTSNKSIDLRTNKGYVVWWNDKPIEDCVGDIKESSTRLNNWIEKLFSYKNEHLEP